MSNRSRNTTFQILALIDAAVTDGTFEVETDESSVYQISHLAALSKLQL